MNCSFSSLVAQHDSCAAQGKVFFTYSKNTPLFLHESIITRFLHRIFYGYSFNLVQNTQKLIQNFSYETISENEERSSLKVLGIVYQMLGSSIKNRPQTGRAPLFTKIDQTAEHLSKRIGTSKVKILLECGCQENAYIFVKNKNLDSSIPVSELEPILQMAYEKEDTNTICFLLNLGVSSAHVQRIPASYFLTIAQTIADRFEDKALSHLIQDQPILGSNGPLYLKASSLGLIDSVKAFINAGKIAPHYVDEYKNTALHHSLSSGNIPLIQFLFNHIDPTLENKNKHTALQEFLSDDNLLDCQISESAIPEFLTLLLKRPENIYQGVSPKHSTFAIHKIQKKLSLDYIEFFFLQNIPLTKLSSSITREDLDASFSFLSKKYPHSVHSVNAFCMQAFSLNKDHLKTGCTQHEIPQEVPNNVQIEALQTLFDSVEWEKEDLPKIYQDVFEKAPGFLENQKTSLQEQLRFFLTRLATKEHFLGTPLEGSSALLEFYAKIELALRHCCAKLIELNNNTITISFIKEILRGSKNCGGRWFQTAINQYLLICKELVNTPRGLFERLLAEYRQLCLEGIVTELYRGEVHGLTNASKDLGKELGIPGSDTTFNDIYTIRSYNKDTIRSIFFEKAYTPYSIVFDHFFPLLSQDAEVADNYIDLHKENIPSWWNQEKYQVIHDELQAIPPSLAPEERTQTENEILEKYDIMKAPKMSAQASVEEDRRSDYLEKFVYGENGKRTFFGLIYALERLGIIQCSLPYKDGSKKVYPLPPQEEYRKVSLFSGIVSSIGSFFKNLFW